jgi:hypothetical protein
MTALHQVGLTVCKSPRQEQLLGISINFFDMHFIIWDDDRVIEYGVDDIDRTSMRGVTRNATDDE